MRILVIGATGAAGRRRGSLAVARTGTACYVGEALSSVQWLLSEGAFASWFSRAWISAVCGAPSSSQIASA